MQLADLFFDIDVHGGSATMNTINNLHNKFKNLGSMMTGIGKTFMGFGAAMTAGLTLPVAGLVGQGLKFNMTMEDLQSNFKVLLGSEEKAIEMTQKLKKMGAETPFEVTGLADATKTLLSFGVSEEKVIPIMTRLGDVSLGNTERFKSLSLVMGQVSANGKLQGDDLNQFIDAGWNPLQQIIAKTGETMTEVRDRMSEGKVSYKEVQEALKDATSEGGRFYKGMEEGSKTLSGRISTLKDNFNELLGNATKPLFNFISQKAIPFITKLVEKFNKLSPEIKQIISIFALLIAAIGPVVFVFGGLIVAVGAVITAITTIVGGIAAVISGLGLLLIPIGLVGGAFALLTGILAGVGIAYLVDRFGSLKGVFQALQIFINESLVPAFKYLASGEGLGKVNEASFITRDRLKSIRDTFISIKNFIFESLVPALQYLATGEGLGKVKNASGGVKEVLKAIRKTMVNIYSYIVDTLVPSLQYLATGEGLGKVEDKGTDLRNNLALLRKKLVDLRNYINDTVIPTIKYFATGDEGSLNNAKNMSNDTKDSIKTLRSWISNLIKTIQGFDGSTMIKVLSFIINKVSSAISIIGKLIGIIGKLSTVGVTIAAINSIANLISIAKTAINTVLKLANIIANLPGGGILSKLSPWVGHARGIMNSPFGHFAVVGEEGPETMFIPKHASIFTAAQTKQMFDTANLTKETNKLAGMHPTISNKEESIVWTGDIIIDAKDIEEIQDVLNVLKGIKQYKNRV